MAASSEQNRNKALKDLLQDDFPSVARYLAARETYPLTLEHEADQTWIEYIQKNCQETSDGFDLIISKYSTYMNVENIENMRDFMESPLIESVKNDFITSGEAPNDLFNKQSFEDNAEEHVQALLRVANFVDEYTEDGLDILYSSDYISESTTVETGCSRIDE